MVFNFAPRLSGSAKFSDFSYDFWGESYIMTIFKVPRRSLQPLGCWSTLSDFLFSSSRQWEWGTVAGERSKTYSSVWSRRKLVWGQLLLQVAFPSGVWNFSCYPSSHVQVKNWLWSRHVCLQIAFSVTKNNFWTKPNQRMLLQSCDCHEETESFYSVKYSEEKLWPFHVPAFALQVKIWM